MIQGLRIVLIFPVICFAFLFQPSSLHADCLACFELKGVQVTMKDGQKYSGYVGWNHAWFTSREKSRFPDTLLSRESWEPYPREPIPLYKPGRRWSSCSFIDRDTDAIRIEALWFHQARRGGSGPLSDQFPSRNR